ncbi:unnamed protein product, partial [Urochloa humidicola]
RERKAKPPPPEEVRSYFGRRRRSRSCRERRMPPTSSRPRATPSPHHQRYDPEDYFNYYDYDCIEMDFNDEYNYNE